MRCRPPQPAGLWNTRQRHKGRGGGGLNPVALVCARACASTILHQRSESAQYVNQEHQTLKAAQLG